MSKSREPELVRRARVTEATMAKYRDRPFDWRGASCIHLARSHARAMGHRVPKVPRITSPLTAKRALAVTGHADLAALLDSLFPRIAPGEMLVGDLALLPGEADDGGFESVVVSAGSALLGWHGADPSGLKPIKGAFGAVTAAWRL